MNEIMNQSLPSRRAPLQRLLALALALVFCIQLLPLSPDAEALERMAHYSEATVHQNDAGPASSGRAVTNTYILEISTGSIRNGGTADNVEYFVIYYTDTKGTVRSTVLFPGKDALGYGFNKAANVGSRGSRRSVVEQTFGYTTVPLEEQKGLRSVQDDQFLFTTPEPVDTIDRIQVFGKKLESYDHSTDTGTVSSDWACQGMRVFRVDTLYGLEMYGWYSDQGYIDFDGVCIADADMSAGGGIFRWQNSGGAFNITGPGVSGGVAGVTLVNNKNAEAYGRQTQVGVTHGSQVSNRVVFRVDLADMGGAGFESLAGSYEAGSYTKISDLKLCETAALIIRYEDVYGCIRELSAPLIISALGWTMEQLGDVAIAGYAQQGDSIAASLMLPDFASLNSVRFVVGESLAAERSHLITSANADQTIRPGRVSKAQVDSMSYLCVAAYRDVSVQIQADGATLRYNYAPGPENPTQYYTAGGVEGVQIDANSESYLTLLNYYSDLTLLPVDRSEYYLLTICTDNVANSGTVDDIELQFNYITMRDAEATSEIFMLRDYVQRFYGEWPGNTENFAYNYGLRLGGTVQVMIPLQGVKQFKSISVKLDGQDEWQFKGMELRKIKTCGSIVARWEEIDDQGLKSHLVYSRDVTANEPCFSIGVIYDPDHPPVEPGEEGWIPGTLVQDDNEFHEYDGRSREVSTQDEIDWGTYRYYMTYEDTLQDLGFTRQRCMYEVQVNVAGDKVNVEDDDCGSANLFYFQLVFEYGKSGCVLANQQLSADAFRTGAKATFKIPTTQDYGELTAIRIIPDDQDSNGNIYDKLKISSITVRKQSTGKISPTWTADSDSRDGLGWVGIDYRDPGAVATNRGAEGRSINEIAHTYQINKTSYSTKLLISIKTGNYASTPKTGPDGEQLILQDQILQGGMSMSFNYYNHDGRVEHVDPVDIVRLMNEYSGRSDVYARTIDDVTENVDYSVSNPDYQFRPGTTDNFYIDVDNISQIIDMQLQIRSSVVTRWNIESVSVYLVQGSGMRYINANGEYDYKYPDGEGLSFRCTWNRAQSLVKDVQIYRTDQKNSIGEVNITFNENEFPLYDDEMWNTFVTREPASKDDSFNLFIYPSTESAASNPNSYDLLAELLYTNTLTQSAMQTATGVMSRTTDSSGRPVFYALGLNASYVNAINGVNVWTNAVRPVHAPISYGVLQQIRGGVLIDSYYLMGMGNADNGLTLHITANPNGSNLQRVFLQMDKNMTLQDLQPEEKDLAVAVYFRTDDAFGGELRTKYVFLTDCGYTEIHPGEVLEVDFSIENLKEITGMNLVSVGRLDVAFENGLVIEQSASGAMRNKWSFQGRLAPSRNPVRFDPTGDVCLLDLDLTTAENDGAVNSGTNGPIRMDVGYYNRSGAEMTMRFDNLRDYMQGDRGFQPGQTDHIRLLVPAVTELRWIELEPLRDPNLQVTGTGQETPAPATWKLASLTAMLDLSGYYVTRLVDQLIVEHEPLRISLADLLLAGTVSIILNPTDRGNVAGDYSIPTNGNLDVALNPGEGIRVVPILNGSEAGVEVVLNRYDPATGGLGRPDLMDTRGYTAALLESYAQAAGPAEAAVWRSVVPDNGTWEVRETVTGARRDTDSIVFLPPHNYTGATMYYRITMTSRENDAAFITINLTVPSEVNPVTQLVADARARDQQGGTEHTHSIVFTPEVAATCMQEGHRAYYSCSGCGKYFSDALGQNEIPDLTTTRIAALGHDWGVWTSDGNGNHSRSCNRCGETETQPCTYGDDGICVKCYYKKPEDTTESPEPSSPEETGSGG